MNRIRRLRRLRRFRLRAEQRGGTKGSTSNSAPLGWILEERKISLLRIRRLRASRLRLNASQRTSYTADTRTRSAIAYRGHSPQARNLRNLCNLRIILLCALSRLFKAFLHPPDSVPASDPLLVPIFSRSFASIRGLFGVSPICVNLRLSAV
jgi:hypothetical protein